MRASPSCWSAPSGSVAPGAEPGGAVVAAFRGGSSLLSQVMVSGARSISLGVTRPDHEARLRDGFLAVASVVWLGYTAIYPALSSAHHTLPLCPFLVLTGHPCPLCGGTRAFAAMWSGDITHAARLHPLVPLLFPLTFIVAAYGMWAVLTSRSISVTMSAATQRWISVAGLAAIAVSWSAKLLWLGN